MAAHPEEKGGRTDEQIWVAYGETYTAMFEAFYRAEMEGSRERAVEAGRRGISYLVRAQAYDLLGFLASGVVISTRNPRLLSRVIGELEGVIEQASVGRARWRLRAYLADALSRGGRPDAALPFYEQAVAEAEETGHWNDVGWICQNWANTLANIGRLADAKFTFLRSARAAARTSSPRVDFLASELGAFLVDVRKGGGERALPEIESRLQEIRVWWRRHRAGEPVPEAPDPVVLARALIAGLDIAREANLALKRSEACLGFLTEIEEIQRALGEGEHELARTRFNRYGPLLHLGRLDEAQRVLESCLAIFQRVGDLSKEAWALSALADLWDEREDREQAASLERKALAVRNRLSDLEGRSSSHSNLSCYLDRLGAAEEAAWHRLAGISYLLILGHGQHLATALHNLAVVTRRAAVSGRQYELPRLADLLARPEFEPLQRTLTEWDVAPDELQAQIDELVEQVRGRVERSPEEPTGA
jgi:tetratricopeptide (TPR) repeat protein